MDIFLSFIITLLVLFIVPIFIYSLFVRFGTLKEPNKKLSFMIGVSVQKAGTAFGFVGLFFLGKDYFDDNWLAYSLIWVVMFAIVEIGQAIGPNYSKKEAAAGIISEVIYFPLAGAAVMWLGSL